MNNPITPVTVATKQALLNQLYDDLLMIDSMAEVTKGYLNELEDDDTIHAVNQLVGMRKLLAQAYHLIDENRKV